MPRWLDVDTAGAIPLHDAVTRCTYQVARVQLPFVRHGRLLRFDRLALDRWLEKEVKYGFGEARRASGTCARCINGQVYRESTGFADKKAAERRANEIELDIPRGLYTPLEEAPIPSASLKMVGRVSQRRTRRWSRGPRMRDAQNRRALPAGVRREAARRDHEVRALTSRRAHAALAAGPQARSCRCHICAVRRDASSLTCNSATCPPSGSD